MNILVDFNPNVYIIFVH